MTALHAGLAWLPPPEDFVAQCRSLDEDTAVSLGRRVQALARHGLDENQLHRLARAIARARERGRSLAPLAPFRLGLISNATTHLLAPALVATAARHGIALDCIEAEYGQGVRSPAVRPLYADHVGRLLAAARGKSRRCLILDLDNTVWQGVIGDGSRAAASPDACGTAAARSRRGFFEDTASRSHAGAASARSAAPPDELRRWDRAGR